MNVKPIIETKLKTKLVVIPVIVIVLALVGVVTFSLISFENVSRKNLEDNQKLLVDSMSFTVDEFLNKYRDVITMTRKNKIAQDTSEYNNIKIETRGLSDNEALELRQFFKDSRETYPEFAYLETFTPDKAINVVLEPYEAQLDISEESYKKGFAFRDWYIGAMESKDTYISEAYVSASIMKPVTAISTPIYDGQNNVTAILIGAVELSDLSHTTQKLKYKETGITYIVDKNSHLVAHPDDKYFKEKNLFDMSDNEIVKSAIQNNGQLESSQIMFDNITGEKVFVYYKKVDATDWYIISQQSVTEAISSIRTITLVVGTGTILLILLVIFILYTNANNILKPLIKLTDISKKVSKNNLAMHQEEMVQLRKHSERSDEIGVLCRSFKSMLENLIQIVTSITHATNEVFESSDVISMKIKEIHGSATQIDTTVQEIATAACDQATETMNGAQMTNQLEKIIDSNREKMENLNTSFAVIKESTDIERENLYELKLKNKLSNEETYTLYDNIKETNESSKRISAISHMIASVAEQTNLLALNAAIQAARGGAAGKGFAVVADEIRNLAEESTKSTKQIDELLKELQSNSNISVQSINSLMEVSKKQLEFLNQSEEQNKKIMVALKEEEGVIDDLNIISQQISHAKDRIIEIITDLSAVAEENAAGCEETSATVTQQSNNLLEISEISDRLKQVVEKLNNEVDKFSKPNL